MGTLGPGHHCRLNARVEIALRGGDSAFEPQSSLHLKQSARETLSGYG